MKAKRSPRRRACNAPVPAAPRVEISTAPGAITIDAPELFAGGDESLVPRLLERLLAVPAVEEIDVDQSAAAVTVRYDRRRTAPTSLLRDMAAMLHNAPADPADFPGEVDLRSIPGRVTRVERRRHGASVVTTIFSVGTGILASCSKIVGRAARRAPSANGEPAADEVVQLDGWRIHFRRPAEIATTGEPQLLTGEARRLDIRPAGAEAAEPGRTLVQRQVVVARGFRRLANLAAAGGCFVMSFVGLVTPGIPTVPFVLATSYFLVRSSPALDDRLRRSRIFGQMVRDWEAYGGMRPGTKLKFIWLTLAIVTVTIVVAGPSPMLLAIIGVMAALGVTIILRLPTVPEDAPDDLTAFAPA